MASRISAPMAVTPRTRPPLVTVCLPRTSVPAWNTFTPSTLAALFSPLITLPVS